VFFGGAGVSTESGIPDFRSVDGLYNQKYDYPPETILSHSFFQNNTAEFYKFYRDKMLVEGAKPNPAHTFLADHGIPVVTQNIDGLHSAASGGDVWDPAADGIYELHGSVHRNYCVKCGAKYGIDKIKAAASEPDGIPRCSREVPADGEIGPRPCNGLIKPDVVLYEEPLNAEVWKGAEAAVRAADLMIVGGTSLTVYPASSLVRMFRGSKLVLINRDETAMDSSADLILRDPIGQVFAQLSR
jgi:NAD-dependent deacetylase